MKHITKYQTFLIKEQTTSEDDLLVAEIPDLEKEIKNGRKFLVGRSPDQATIQKMAQFDARKNHINQNKIKYYKISEEQAKKIPNNQFIF
jgi:hypothetical protein